MGKKIVFTELVAYADLKNIIIVNNQSQNTKEQVSTLENSIFSGVILVVLVLMFFLGVRNALFVGLSIPLSMCISFIILQLFGITVNMMILFSLDNKRTNVIIFISIIIYIFR